MASSVTKPSCIAEWDVRGKATCLFNEGEHLSFSTEGVNGKRSSFRSKYCDINSALKIVRKFHAVIRTNLERQEASSACFLPFCVFPVQTIPDCEVALFGRVIPGEREQIVQWARYGVALPTGSLSFERADGNDALFDFVNHAPTTNQTIMEPVLDDKGNPIKKKGVPLMQESSSSRPMDAYVKRFRLMATKNREEQISQLALQHVSALDPNVFLDTENWAITLVSTKTCSHAGFLRKFFMGSIGHAMLACEGVIDRRGFLEYIHLTQTPRERLPNLKDNAQIEQFTRERPLDTENGPTWRRSRAAIENLFRVVAEKKRAPIPFALYRPRFMTPSDVFMLIKISDLTGADSSREMIEHITKQEQKNPTTESKLNCLNCVVQLAEHAGVIFYGHVNGTTPLRKIVIVKTAPVYQIPDGLQRFKGHPLYPEQEVVVNFMLSACVVLTANDCPPEDFLNWANQVAMEETWATDREIDRLQTMPIGATWNEYNPKRWK